MPTSSESASGRYIQPLSDHISRSIQEKCKTGVTNNEASTASLVDNLKEFDQELAELDDQDREVLLSVFRTELTTLLFLMRTEVAVLKFTPPHLRH